MRFNQEPLRCGPVIKLGSIPMEGVTRSYNLTGYFQVNNAESETGEQAPLWCTLLVFNQANGQCFMTPIILHQANYQFEDLHFKIPLECTVHHIPYGCMDRDGCLRDITQLSNICRSYSLNNKVIIFDVYDSHFNDRALIHMKQQNIQPFVLKSGNFGNDHTNDNGPNANLMYHFNHAKSTWTTKYGTAKILPHDMKFIFVEAWIAFKVSVGNIIRDNYVKTKLPPLSTPKLITNTQAYSDYVRVSSEPNTKEIHGIKRHNVAPIDVEETRTSDTMVFLKAEGI